MPTGGRPLLNLALGHRKHKLNYYLSDSELVLLDKLQRYFMQPGRAATVRTILQSAMYWWVRMMHANHLDDDKREEEIIDYLDQIGDSAICFENDVELHKAILTAIQSINPTGENGETSDERHTERPSNIRP